MLAWFRATRTLARRWAHADIAVPVTGWTSGAIALDSIVRRLTTSARRRSMVARGLSYACAFRLECLPRRHPTCYAVRARASQVRHPSTESRSRSAGSINARTVSATRGRMKRLTMVMSIAVLGIGSSRPLMP